MTLVERILRAGAALIAGGSIALGHFRHPIEAASAAPIKSCAIPCPECGRSLLEGPHFHGDRAYWPITDYHGVLVTTATGEVLR